MPRRLHPIAQTGRITEAVTPREIDQRFFAIVTDLIGTPTELADETGDIAWHTRTTLWGTTTWTTDSTTYTPLRFPGQYYDPETDLHYNFHRYYDPETARFSQRTVSPNDYVDKMRSREWDWERAGTALKVMEVDGHSFPTIIEGSMRRVKQESR